MYTPVKNMEEESKNGSNETAVKVKVPKRVLHFSDGVLEEYSDDEVDKGNASQKQESAIVDPKTMTWGPWLLYKTWSAGASALSVCDNVGEHLAAFFGITTPKYYFEIEEYKKREVEKKALEEEAKGWSQPSDASRRIRTNMVAPAREESSV